MGKYKKIQLKRAGVNEIARNAMMTLLITYSILMSYRIPGIPLPLADVILIGAFPFLLMSEIGHGTKLYANRIYIIVYILYILGNFGILCMLGVTDWSQCGMRMCRYVLYWCTLFFLNKNFEIATAMKIFRCVGLASAIMLLIQNIGITIFNVYIPAHLSSPAISENVGLQEQIHNILNNTGRPFAFFSEPSVVAYFLAVILFIELFYRNRINCWIVLILSMGILLSMSSTGLLLMLFVWIMWGVRWSYKSRKFTTAGIFLSVCLMIGIAGIAYILSKTGRWASLIERIGSKNVWLGRFGGYALFKEDRGIIQTFFGCGMNDNYKYFLPGIPRTYYYFGIVGCALLFIVIIFLMLRITPLSRVFIVMLVLAETGGIYFYGQFILAAIPFIVLKGSKSERDLLDYT